jgi:hypothetical protein
VSNANELDTIKVRLPKGKTRIWNACAGDWLEPGKTADVSDVPYWHNLIKKGLLVRVDDGPTRTRSEDRDRSEPGAGPVEEHDEQLDSGGAVDIIPAGPGGEGGPEPHQASAAARKRSPKGRP